MTTQSTAATAIVTGKSALASAFEQRLISDMSADDPAVAKAAMEIAAVVYISEMGRKSLFEKIADQQIGRH